MATRIGAESVEVIGQKSPGKAKQQEGGAGQGDRNRDKKEARESSRGKATHKTRLHPSQEAVMAK